MAARAGRARRFDGGAIAEVLNNANWFYLAPEIDLWPWRRFSFASPTAGASHTCT
jgi:hypothetical protein